MTWRRMVYRLARDWRRPGIEYVQELVPERREPKGDRATTSPMRTMRMRPCGPVLKDADIPIVNLGYSRIVQFLCQHQDQSTLATRVFFEAAQQRVAFDGPADMRGEHIAGSLLLDCPQESLKFEAKFPLALERVSGLGDLSSCTRLYSLLQRRQMSRQPDDAL